MKRTGQVVAAKRLDLYLKGVIMDEP
jgi:hypothetical protein